ncbi:MAG: ankyrin repeat domain-containing protein [Cellvibrionales bacterium]|nr:ankyrin repeat domain-containing protein [Cellvibrionales bacterium]
MVFTAADIQRCVDRGIDIERRDAMGWTPLHGAAAYGSADTVRALLKAGAEIDARTTNDAETPLHKAAWFAKPDITAALLDAGADPNVRKDNGYTPLHFAAILTELHFPGQSRAEVMRLAPSKAKIVRALLSAGANPRARDDMYGDQPADLAAKTLLRTHPVNLELDEARRNSRTH